MLNLFNANDENPKEGQGKDSLLHLYFDILFIYSFDLIKLNFLFLLACLPIITIPAAITGVSWVVSLMVRKKEYTVWKNFWKRFISDFWQSLFFGVICAGLYYLLGVSILYYINVMASSWLGLALLVVFAFLVSVPVMMSLYCFSLVATVKLSLFSIIKNALLLSFLNFRRNTISLMLFILAAALTLRYYPLSLGVYILPVVPLLRFIDLSIQFPVIETFVASKN